jgi:DNA-binding SARP family transcriptional activator
MLFKFPLDNHRGCVMGSVETGSLIAVFWTNARWQHPKIGWSCHNSGVRLQLLGQPSLLTPHQHYALSGYSAYVLTWLVLHGKNAPLNARIRLARALWTDTDEDQARRRLVNTLYRLKRDVPELEPHLVGDANTIGLQNVACDALEFETQMRQPEPSQWLVALDLYSADLLEGQDLPWLEEWRL